MDGSMRAPWQGSMRRSPRALHARGWALRWAKKGESRVARTNGPRRGRRFRPLVVALSSALAIALGAFAGSAYGYFSSTGAGSGHGTVGTTVSVTLSAATATPSLVPGGSGTVYFTVKNTNSLSVTLTSVTAASVTTSSNGSCPTTNLTAPTIPYSSFTPITVGGQTTSGTEAIAGLVKLATSAPTACQGVTFTLSLTVSGKIS